VSQRGGQRLDQLPLGYTGVGLPAGSKRGQARADGAFEGEGAVAGGREGCAEAGKVRRRQLDASVRRGIEDEGAGWNRGGRPRDLARDNRGNGMKGSVLKGNGGTACRCTARRAEK
jgi:hypothetical protein